MKTREVGTIQPDLEVWLDAERPDRVRIRYVGAEEAYTVKGKAAGSTLAEIVELLATDAGIDDDGNPLFTDFT